MANGPNYLAIFEISDFRLNDLKKHRSKIATSLRLKNRYIIQFSRLEQIKTEDPILFEELGSLLAADSMETSLLDGFAIENIDLSELVPMEGIQIGPFEIERQIGSGRTCIAAAQ